MARTAEELAKLAGQDAEAVAAYLAANPSEWTDAGSADGVPRYVVALDPDQLQKYRDNTGG